MKRNKLMLGHSGKEDFYHGVSRRLTRRDTEKRKKIKGIMKNYE